MAEITETTSSEKKDSAQIQPLEIVFTAALGGAVSLIKDPTFRSLAAVAAAPVGYSLAKLGRWVITFWVPQWLSPKPDSLATLEKRTKVYIADLRKELENTNLTPVERRQKLRFIQQFEDALHQRRLAELQIVPPAAPGLEKANPEEYPTA